MSLPNNIARCPGVGSDEEGWREGCEQCLRRTKPTSESSGLWMSPPPIIAFWCDFLIELGEEELLKPDLTDGRKEAE